MDSLEKRYAYVHPYTHHYTLAQDELQIRKQNIMNNSHGLLFYKKQIIETDAVHVDESAIELFSRLRAIVDHQRQFLQHKTLRLDRTHKLFLQSAHLPVMAGLQPSRKAAHNALRLALPFYPDGALTEISEKIHTTTCEELYHGICFVAAHDAYNLQRLHTSLHRQHKALTHSSINKETQRKVMNYLRACFVDEIHAHAALAHQQLHSWATKNTVFP